MDEAKSVTRINVRFRMDDETENKASQIIASIPMRKKSHFIAEAIVKANAMTASVEELDEDMIDRLASAIADKLKESSVTVKRKVGRPRKSSSENPSSVLSTSESKKPVRGRPRKVAAAASVEDSHSSLIHAHNDRNRPSPNQVDADMVDSMMSLMS